MLQELKRDQAGLETTAKKYGIGVTTLIEWRDRFEQYEYDGLEHQNHNRSYSAEAQTPSGKRLSIRGLSLKTYVGGAKAMAKGRSTTWQERVDIFLYCLAP